MRKAQRYIVWASIMAAFLLLVTLSCSQCMLRKPDVPTGPHIKVLTWNINWGMSEAYKTLAVLRDAGADIVCLQETTANWETLLRGELSSEYPYMRFRHFGGAGGQAVLAKKPFQEREYVLPKDAWFPGWICDFDTDVGPLQILSVHLHPQLNDRGSFTLSAYSTTKKVRFNEVQTLFPLLQKETPSLILGDFNEDESDKASQWVAKQGFTDALYEFDRESRTWKWKVSIVMISKRFDRIFYSPGLYCFSAEVIEGGGSDHFPVMAIFKLHMGILNKHIYVLRWIYILSHLPKA
jgi:endonuclease/exonuclease/phosphatase family metal-dependent hydrolase